MFTKGLFDTERLRIRTFRRKDFERFLDIALDKEVQKYFKGLGQSVSEISEYFDLLMSQDRQYNEALAITLRTTHQIIGYIGAFSMPPETLNVEYFLAKEFRECRYGTEAFEGLISYIRIFYPHIRYISLMLDKKNIASQELLSNFGPEIRDFDTKNYEYIISL